MADLWSQEYNDDILIPERDAELSVLEGGITHAEGLRLAKLASLAPKGYAIVEIGSYRGRSTCYLASGSKMGESNPVYAIDPWDINTPYPGATRPYWDKDNREAFDTSISKFNLNDIVVPIKNFSLEAVKTWDKPIGLLFIDGNHAYTAVRDDFWAWQGFVVKGGVIIFHDYNLTVSVKRFVDTIIHKIPILDDMGTYNRVISFRKRGEIDNATEKG